MAVAINALNDRIAAWERWREDRPVSEEDLAAGQLIATAGRRLRPALSLGVALMLLYAVSFAGIALFANAL